MKHLLIITSFLLLLCLNIQAQQFRMVSTGIISWSVLTDSTYSATITFNSDLTGGSFLPNQIVDTFQMFTDNQQLYTVDSVLSTTLSQANIRVKEYGTTNGTPSGQVMVYNPQGRSAVPTVNFGSAGASAKMQAAVITYNASVSGEDSEAPDGSETIVGAGYGVNITGSGTTGDPYEAEADTTEIATINNAENLAELAENDANTYSDGLHAADLDQDTTNELITSTIERGDSIFVIEGGVEQYVGLRTILQITPRDADTMFVNLKSRRASKQVIRIDEDKAILVDFQNPADTGLYSLYFTDGDFTDLTFVDPVRLYDEEICKLVVPNNYHAELLVEQDDYSIIDESGTAENECFSYIEALQAISGNEVGTTMMLKKQNITKDLTNSTLLWSGATDYDLGDYVTYNPWPWASTTNTFRSVFIAIADPAVGEEPTVDTDVWEPMTEMSMLVPFEQHGAGKYIRYNMEHGNEEFIRNGRIDVGTVAETSTNFYNGHWSYLSGSHPDSTISTGSANKVLGDTIEFYFYGNEVRFAHNEDNRGTMWQFTYVSGMDSLAPPDTVNISTYNATPVTTVIDVVFTGLTYGAHLIRGIAVANTIDPASDDTRAWYKVGTSTATFRVYATREIFTADFTMVTGTSNQEFAWSYRLADSTGHGVEWFPEHSGNPTTDNFEKDIYIDNVLTPYSDFNRGDFRYSEIQKVRVIQRGYGTHPQAAVPLLEYNGFHEYTPAGVYWRFRMDILEETLISTGYNNMVPAGRPAVDRFTADNGGSMTWPLVITTQTPLPDSLEDRRSYIFYNSNISATAGDVAVALDFPSPKRTWRTGLSGTGASHIQYNSSSIHKFYPLVFSNYTVNPGEIYEVQGKLHVNKLVDANDNIPVNTE